MPCPALMMIFLAKGLALRDGAASAAEAVSSSPKADKPTTVVPPLYDLTRHSDKPPRKSPWRVLAVMAAACLLFCVIPLSMWMVGNLAKSDEAVDGADTQSNFEGILGDMTATDDISNAPQDGGVGEEAPDMEAPIDTEGAKEPEAAETDRNSTHEENATPPELSTEFEPHELIWSADPSVSSTTAYYTAAGHNGTDITLIATTSDDDVSAEDEMVLQMVGQWLASVCSLHYGDHFPLFYESFVQEVFIQETVRHGKTYQTAISEIGRKVAALLPIDRVELILHLEENTLLAGEELETYRATKPSIQTARGFSPELISAVRRVRVSGGVELDGFYPFESMKEILNEAFYIYEYEGKWYLDEALMDDDLCIDLLGASKEDTGFYQIKTTEGGVVAMDDTYLYLDTGDAFRVDSALFHNQTDGGEWVVRVGDTVTVSHYTLKMGRLTRTVDGVENEEWTLSTATEVNYYGRANVHNG